MTYQPIVVNHPVQLETPVKFVPVTLDQATGKAYLLECSFVLADDGDYLVTVVEKDGVSLDVVEAVRPGVTVEAPFSLRKLTLTDLDRWAELFPNDSGLLIRKRIDEPPMLVTIHPCIDGEHRLLK